MTEHQLWIAGEWVAGSERKQLRAPFDATLSALVHQASDAQMRKAIQAAGIAFQTTRYISRYARARLLQAMVAEIAKRRSEFVASMILEAGKPKALAEVEVSRALITFTTASEEAKRLVGDVHSVDHDPAARAYAPAVSYFVPRGPVLGITPFNFPLNLVAHKVAPALACGATIVIKPAPQAPGGAVILARCFEAAVQVVNAELGPREVWPLAALQVVSCSNEVASIAVHAPEFATLSFTGSTRVGWLLQKEATGKKVALELGGNAAVLVAKDANLARAAARCAAGGFGYAGQTCISVQRIFVEAEVASTFEQHLLAEVAKISSGDPSADGVTNGPVIDRGARDRIESWIQEATSRGARVLTGGTRIGGEASNIIAPTVIAGTPSHLPLACEEVFGPVVLLDTVESFDVGLTRINDSRFGLQAGVFTDSSLLQEKAIRDLDVGAVLINEIPTFRADPLPYGGSKESGIGREGIRFAMEEYCDRKTVIRYLG